MRKDMTQGHEPTIDPVPAVAQSLLPLHALGALEPDESRTIEVHIDNGCSRCSRALAVYSTVAAALADTVARRPPSDLIPRRIKRLARNTTRRVGDTAPAL